MYRRGPVWQRNLKKITHCEKKILRLIWVKINALSFFCFQCELNLRQRQRTFKKRNQITFWVFWVFTNFFFLSRLLSHFEKCMNHKILALFLTDFVLVRLSAYICFVNTWIWSSVIGSWERTIKDTLRFPKNYIY